VSSVRAWLRRLRLFVFRDRATRELEDEMRLHRELRAAAMETGGTSRDAATIAARRTFGNPAQLTEQSRDAWGLAWLDDLRQDVRYAARRLRQRPAFTTSVAVILALGIGATTAMFSAVDAAILRPLPFPHAEQLVTLPQIQVDFDAAGNFPKSPEHWVSIVDAQAMHSTFSHVAAWAAGGTNLSDAERPIRLNVGVVTADFFATLAVPPLRGRTFLPDDGKPHAPHVAVLSYGLWHTQFDGRNMLNRTVLLNNKPYLVVGVMPRGFSFPRQSDLWIPLSIPVTSESFEPFRGFLPAQAIARVAPGVSVTTASRHLLAQWQLGFAPALRDPAETDLRSTIADLASAGAAIPLQRDLIGDRRTALLVLLGATGLLLLIACVNVTNLMLSQAAGRQREIAVRAVLGASRWRLVRQLLIENVILAMSGGVAAVALAPALLRLVGALMPQTLTDVMTPVLDVRVLGFAAAVALAVGIGFGVWPALATTSSSTVAIKTGGDRGSTSSATTRVRRSMLVAELALSVMMLIGAGLLLRSMARLLDVNRGIQTDHVGTLEFSFPASTDAPTRIVRMQRILDRLRASPGISATGLVNDLPLTQGGGISVSVAVDGVPRPKDENLQMARYLVASSDYFKAMGIPLLRGHTFDAGDNAAAAPVAVISSAMAKAYWPGVDPVGRTFHSPMMHSQVTVIGVVGDVREETLDQAPGLQTYFPFTVQPPLNVALVARATLTPTELLSRMRAAVRAVDPSQAIFHVRTMDDLVDTSVAPRHADTLLITLFALLGVVLAVVGVYAVVAHGVMQRRREFGIRAALGATGANMLQMVVRETLPVTLIGVLAGLIGAWTLARVTSSLLYGVTVHDPLTFVFAPVALIIPVIIATLIPARRAARVNPADVMRAE
jgi:predicted permease